MDNFETRLPIPRAANDIIDIPQNRNDGITHLSPRDNRIPSSTDGNRQAIGKIIPIKKVGIRMRRKAKATKAAPQDSTRYLGDVVKTPTIPSITGGVKTGVTAAKLSLDYQTAERRDQDILIKIEALNKEEFRVMQPLSLETVVQNLRNLDHPDDSDDLLKDLKGRFATRKKRANQLKRESHLNHIFLDAVAKELMKGYPKLWINVLNLDRVIIIAREILTGDSSDTRIASMIENWSRMALPR